MVARVSPILFIKRQGCGFESHAPRIFGIFGASYLSHLRLSIKEYDSALHKGRFLQSVC